VESAHVQFLGEGVAVMSPSYPTTPEGCAMRQAESAECSCRNQRRSNKGMEPTGMSRSLIDNLRGFEVVSRRLIPGVRPPEAAA
jgi:hypothetical protein